MILCQVCQTPNTLDSEYCKQCGAKLLVIGGNRRWEEHNTPSFSLEDHFLERISNLEDTVTNILDHLTALAENMESVDRNGFITRSGLTALIKTLTDTQDLKDDVLREHWEATIVEQMEEARVRDRFFQLKSRFLALYRSEKDKETKFQAAIDDAEFQIISGNLEIFMDCLETALEFDPSNYELAYFLGELSFELERGDQEHFLQLALTSNPDHADSLLMLAVYYYGHDKLKESEALLDRALALNARDDAALLCLASIYTTREDFSRARPILETVIEIRPQAQAHYLMGIGYKEQGKWKKAKNHLEKATELDSELEDAFYMLGFVYLHLGWTRKAKKAFSEALVLNPMKMEYQEALNFDQPKAEMSLEGLDPLILERFQKAEQLFKQQKFKAASNAYRQLVKKAPDNPVFLCSLAVSLFSLQRWEEVIKITTRLLSLETSEIFSCIGFTLQMESERALEHFEEALKTLGKMESSLNDPYGKSIATYGIVLTLADMGEELLDAKKLAVLALESAPEEFKSNLLDALGWVYFKLEQNDKSLECLEQALELREDVSTLQHYGLVLLAVNLQEKALEVFSRLLELRGQAPAIDPFIFRSLEKESMRFRIKGIEEYNKLDP